MDSAPTTLCPACGHTDPDCLVCGGSGEVAVGAWEPCPAEHSSAYYRPRCRHCGGSRWVKADDFEAIRDRLNEDAYAEGMARRGLHVSGTPFSGPF